MAKIDTLIQYAGVDALPRCKRGTLSNGWTIKRGGVYGTRGDKLNGATIYRAYGMLDYIAVYGDANNYAGYQVHHVNGKHGDNRRSNCITISNELHTFLHQVMALYCNASRYHYATAQEHVTTNVKATYQALALWGAGVRDIEGARKVLGL